MSGGTATPFGYPHGEPITLATVAAGLQAFARADIRDLPLGSVRVEPVRCRRCLDTGTVVDLAGWEPSWLWQRYRPVPRTTCPDCGSRERA